MSTTLSAPPVLSTPDSHILAETEPPVNADSAQTLSDEQLIFRYEIERTVREIRQQRWRRIALQFPDSMLPHSVQVYQLLAGRLRRPQPAPKTSTDSGEHGVTESLSGLQINETESAEVKLTILGDTSYGSCCVDEVAAEHVDADAIVHYGRSCMSPTARLPVIYVFTQMELDHDAVRKEFHSAFGDHNARVVLTADGPFASHIQAIYTEIRNDGYSNIVSAPLIHEPSSLIPNRELPDFLKQDPDALKDWNLFHISNPPTSLLLTLSSRMNGVHLFSTSDSSDRQLNSAIVLRRRYALITSLSTVDTWGILINTLSVKDYLHVVDHVKKQIADAGKKSYLFVVGKLNAAKVANFAEIGGWVVVGCWESSLVDSRDFYKPIITPFELELVLQDDDKRIWTGEWRGDFQAVLQDEVAIEPERSMPGAFLEDTHEAEESSEGDHNYDSEEESAPPEFDLRTGKYVSQSRPRKTAKLGQAEKTTRVNGKPSSALVKRANGDILAVNGVASPGAEYLARKRTWRGLGTDFEIQYDEEEQGGLIEEGRTGIASGYTTAATQLH